MATHALAMEGALMESVLVIVSIKETSANTKVQTATLTLVVNYEILLR